LLRRKITAQYVRHNILCTTIYHCFTTRLTICWMKQFSVYIFTKISFRKSMVLCRVRGGGGWRWLLYILASWNLFNKSSIYPANVCDINNEYDIGYRIYGGLFKLRLGGRSEEDESRFISIKYYIWQQLLLASSKTKTFYWIRSFVTSSPTKFVWGNLFIMTSR